MNNVDKQYLSLLKDIIENGTYKNTRSGGVYSVFGRTMRFNLKEGLPLLTTKKVFVKGIIHELLWFLKGETNIKYLVDNNVHIWDDDSYRHYLDIVNKHNELCHLINYNENKIKFDWSGKMNVTKESFNKTNVKLLSKEDFLNKVKNNDCEYFIVGKSNEENTYKLIKYYYGDLGPVYGKQWRGQGKKNIDQIKTLIETLKNNPDDRRMICMAWNTNEMDEMALPPCHYGFQVYTRELTEKERWEIFENDFLKEDDEEGDYNLYVAKSEQYKKGSLIDYLDRINVPKRELSLSFSMRSNDFCCGNPYNICQYSFLAYMLCEVCNMVPGELIYNGGDVHVYENHIESAKEQLSRSGNDELPILKFNRKILDIDDFKYDDFIIENYKPDSPIKYELNVGL